MNKLLSMFFKICAFMTIIIVMIICYFIFKNGIKGINEIGFFNFIFTSEWFPEENIFGIFPMIITSLYVTILSLLFTVPLGLGAAIYLTFFLKKGKFRDISIFIIEISSGIPSIVFGLFGLTTIVPMIRNLFDVQGQSILAASIILTMMIFPTMISVSISSLQQVELSYYSASRALGATKEISIYKIVVPTARSGILSAIILSIGRALGETMAVLMVIGNQARFVFNPLKGARVLTTNIILEMGYAEGLHKDALISTALVLFFFILTINYLFHKIIKRS